MGSILIVDDSSDIRILLQQALEMEGYLVYHAENGNVAKDKLISGIKPDVVLLDLMMPIMDGKEFLKWKNQDPVYRDIPVVVISALAHEELKGTFGYIRKPIDLVEMFQILEECCD